MPAFLVEEGYRQVVDCGAGKHRAQVTIVIDMHRYLALTRPPSRPRCASREHAERQRPAGKIGRFDGANIRIATVPGQS
jgi:hypothetical protein